MFSVSGCWMHLVGTPSQDSAWTVVCVSTICRVLFTKPHSPDHWLQFPHEHVTDWHVHKVFLVSVSGPLGHDWGRPSQFVSCTTIYEWRGEKRFLHACIIGKPEVTIAKNWPIPLCLLWTTTSFRTNEEHEKAHRLAKDYSSEFLMCEKKASSLKWQEELARSVKRQD